MTDTQAVPETPTDEATPTTKGKKHAKRGTRKRLLGEGEGDYCIYEINGDPTKAPLGALFPIPSVPRFEDTVKALKWVRQESGDKLTGKQIMVMRAMEILDIQVQTKTSVVIQSKPRKPVNDPKTDDAV